MSSAIKKLNSYNLDPLYAGLNSLPIIIIEIDKAGRTTHLSGKGLIAAGIDAKKSLGHSIADLFVQRKRVHRVFAEALLDKAFHGELSGSKHSFEVWISPQKNAQAEITGAICMAIDITKRKKAQEALIKSKRKAELAQSTEKKFVANISHQIRTPLNAVIGLAELLSDTPLDSVQSKYIQSIHMASNDLLAIVNDVLDFAKITAGAVQPSNESFIIAKLFTEIKENLQPHIKQTKTNLHFHIDKNIPTILLGDQLRIKQILLNLISNALKFTSLNVTLHKKQSSKTKNKSEVNVKAILEEKDHQFVQVAFVVSDNGIGIPQSQLKNIFKSFTQLNKQLDKFKGTGLGLAITRKLVDALGGSIMVTSKINQGTIFTCILPLRIMNDLQSHKTLNNKHSFTNYKELRGCQVLLIEDNTLNQLVANDMLSNQQANVTIVDHGSKALRLIKKCHFDLILTDINLPGHLDGIQTIKKIRQLKSSGGEKVPIVVISAYYQTPHQQICLQAGANAYLIKPYTKMQLMTVVMNVLAKQTVLSSAKRLENEFLMPRNLRQKLIDAFLQQTPAYIKELTLAIRQQDKQKVNRIIHQLKPSLKYLQLNDLYRQLTDIKGDQQYIKVGGSQVFPKKKLLKFVEDCLKALKAMKEDSP